LDQRTDVIQGDGTTGIHETIVTDLHESGGQDVLQESADEFHDLKGEGS
jgi:hypothetical protein